MFYPKHQNASLSSLSGPSRASRCDVDETNTETQAEANNTEALPATPWHPLFALMSKRFASKEQETSSEVPLNRLPLLSGHLRR